MAAQQQKQNYQRILEHTLEEIGKNGAVPTLLLHSCCAPCSSYVLEYLSQYFEITVFYYNPNIYPETEYRERAREQERLICEMKTENPIHFLEGTYDPSVFMPWQGDMKRTWREENAAFAAMSCVSGKEQLWQNRAVLTILPLHSLSAL